MSRPALKAILRALCDAPDGLTGQELHRAARLNPRGRYAEAVVDLQLADFVVFHGGRYFLNEDDREEVDELLGVA